MRVGVFNLKKDMAWLPSRLANHQAGSRKEPTLEKVERYAKSPRFRSWGKQPIPIAYRITTLQEGPKEKIRTSPKPPKPIV